MKYMKPLTIGVWALVFFQIPIAVSRWNYNGCVDSAVEALKERYPAGYPIKAMAYNYCEGGLGSPPS